MRILYLSLSYIPSRRASSVHVMKMCAALARQGHEVTLVVKRGEELGGDDYERYCVDRNFTLVKLPRPKRRGGGLVYMAGMAATLLRHRRSADLIYCRDQLGTMIAARTNIPLVWEAHGVPRAGWRRKAIAASVAGARTLGVVAISDALRRDLVDNHVVRTDRKIVIAHDACDPPAAVLPRKANARPVVGYVGGLHPGRGVEMVLELALQLSHVDFQIVGGNEKDLARWRAMQLPSNLHLLGFQPQGALPEIYAGIDIVVMPHARTGVLGDSHGIDISRWTSPMKMFEYMASGAAIIASDLPVLQEVLRDGENALIAPAGDVSRWREAVERLVAQPALRVRLAATALDELVTHHTWDARARTVLSGLGLA